MAYNIDNKIASPMIKCDRIHWKAENRQLAIYQGFFFLTT